MHTATQTDELIVWTKSQALEEAKSVFASYDPKFRTVANDKGPVFSKGQVGVVFLSQPDDDHAIETTLATLRNAQVSSIVFYVPHRSADIAFKVGTMVGRKGINAEWAPSIFPTCGNFLRPGISVPTFAIRRLEEIRLISLKRECVWGSTKRRWRMR